MKLALGIAWVFALAACPAVGPSSRVVYRDQHSGFTIRHTEQYLGKRGEPGEIHPAILEYILASPESPLVAYYDLVTSQRPPPFQATADLLTLATEATQLAGRDRARGHHYARALVHRVAPQINKALAHRSSGHQKLQYSMNAGMGGAFGQGYEGTAALWWGVPVDLDAHIVKRDYELDQAESALRTIVYRYQSLNLVVVRSSGTDRQLVWDVSGLAGAFDPAAKLDYDTVAKRIVALHVSGAP